MGGIEGQESPQTANDAVQMAFCPNVCPFNFRANPRGDVLVGSVESRVVGEGEDQTGYPYVEVEWSDAQESTLSAKFPTSRDNKPDAESFREGLDERLAACGDPVSTPGQGLIRRSASDCGMLCLKNGTVQQYFGQRK
jgi:hypothetical protein